MDRLERFFKIRNLLAARRYVTREEFLGELEVSEATFKRDLEYLRERLRQPVVWDPDERAYTLAPSSRVGSERYELPGLWFSSSEVQALLSVDQLLAELEPGLLGELLMPFRDRLRRLVDSGDHSLSQLGQRIRIRSIGARFVPPKWFEQVASATLSRRRLRIDYFARSTGETSVRELSPQRLVHYRDNWYLEAWCHLRGGPRLFSLDAMSQVEPLDGHALDVPEAELDASLSASYGIFLGPPTRTAVLRFTAARARWVAREQWHPEQRGRTEPDGTYVVEIPYSDDRELLLDILRYGSDVEVLEPPALRERVRAELAKAARQYDD